MPALLEHQATRQLTIRAGAIDVKKRQVRVTFSSEIPYDRGDHIEILDHSPGAAVLDRLESGGGAFLDSHKMDSFLGAVQRVWIENRKGNAVLEFGTSALAEEVWGDVRAGLRNNISVGYMIDEDVVETGGEKPVRRVTMDAL